MYRLAKNLLPWAWHFCSLNSIKKELLKSIQINRGYQFLWCSKIPVPLKALLTDHIITCCPVPVAHERGKLLVELSLKHLTMVKEERLEHENLAITQ